MPTWILPATVAAAMVTALVNLIVTLYNAQIAKQTAKDRRNFERLERKRDCLLILATEFKRWRPPTTRDAPFCHELTKPGVTPADVAPELCKAVEAAFIEARRVYETHSHLLTDDTRLIATEKLAELNKHSERLITAAQKPNHVVVGPPLGYAECYLDFYHAVTKAIDKEIAALEQELAQ
jgi:hypothetical protein